MPKEIKHDWCTSEDLDIKFWTVLPEGEHTLRQPEHEQRPNQNDSSDEDDQDSDDSEVTLNRTEPCPVNSRFNINVPPVLPAEPFPAHYKLPHLSKTVKQGLESNDPLVLRASLKRAIKRVFLDLQKHLTNNSLNRHDMETVVRTFCTTFPNTCNKQINHQDVGGSRQDLYLDVRRKLQARISKRKKDKSDPCTNAVRIKQAKRAPKVSDALSEAINGGHHYDLEPLDQDPNSVQKWINEMRETHWPQRQEVKLSSRMQLTKIHRKRLYRIPAGQKPSAILSVYPALFCMRQMLEESKRLYNFVMADKRTSFLTRERLEKALASLRSLLVIKKNSHPGKALLASYDLLAEEDKQKYLMDMVLLGLPFMATRDQPQDLWYTINKPPVSLHTVLTLTYEGTTPFRDGVELKVVHQNEVFTRGVTGDLTISDGFDAAVLTNYLINGQEPGKCLGVWRFANETLYKLPVNFVYANEYRSSRRPHKAGTVPKASIINCIV